LKQTTRGRGSSNFSLSAGATSRPPRHAVTAALTSTTNTKAIAGPVSHARLVEDLTAELSDFAASRLSNDPKRRNYLISGIHSRKRKSNRPIKSDMRAMTVDPNIAPNAIIISHRPMLAALTTGLLLSSKEKKK
jgi:hypothetical protein